MARVVCLIHVNKPFATCNIQALESGVVEQIVRISHTTKSGLESREGDVIYPDLSRLAATHEKPMICFIECHWKVGPVSVERPPGDYRALVAVDHGDLPGCGYVYKDSGARPLHLK